jgi:hypothetical protein
LFLLFTGRKRLSFGALRKERNRFPFVASRPDRTFLLT